MPSGVVSKRSPHMRKKLQRWLFGLLAVGLVGFALLNVLAWNHARAMMRFTGGGSRTVKPEALTLWQKAKVLAVGVNLPRPAGVQPPAALAPDCRSLAIPGPDGITLGAWSVNRGAGAPLVILFHGYSAEKSSLLAEGRALLELGASVLLVDFRGSGDSSEAYTTLGIREADDVAAAVRYAQGALPHSRLILYGQSMGAAAILRAVARNGIKPDGVILEAVFDRMLNTVRHRFEAMGVPSFPSAELLVFWGGRQTGADVFAHNPADYARSLACPALVMHGSGDPRARLEEGRRVFDAAPGPKTFREFPNVGHESYLACYPAEWRQTVAAFLRATAR
jgi:uncharacterized protein